MARSLARPANLQLVSGRRAQRYLSLSGSVVLLSYAIYKQDPLFIVGQSTGMFIICATWFSPVARARRAPPRRSNLERRFQFSP
ncbi:MAG: lipid-A-disaccharide synthase N-terminal domain-containing protein [Gammaproteobacteria bacterium]|nr:lipid-A-disaccharide synthase N-terminal domain-containing protein [Gammaproteobacteria bacterium]